MKKFVIALLIMGMTFFVPAAEVMAKGSSGGRSGGGARSSSSYRSSSSSSRTNSKSTTTRSGATSKVGKAPLKSATPAPKPHTHNGRTYSSSSAPYTNTSGLWVLFFIIATNQNGQKETQCFDKDHKRITCNRDDKSYQRNW